MDLPPATADPRLLLPKDAYYLLVHDLHSSLPPPQSDAPEDLLRRDRAAIAQVASLLPVTAAETTLAGSPPSEDPPTPSEPVSEAELYAAVYPERAALIRRLGRVPDNASFGPPDDAIVRALVGAPAEVCRAC